MLCNKCGNKLNEGASFCPKCGNKVEDKTPINVSATLESQSKEIKKTKKWLVLAITLIVVFLLVFFYRTVINRNILADSTNEEDKRTQQIEQEEANSQTNDLDEMTSESDETSLAVVRTIINTTEMEVQKVLDRSKTQKYDDNLAKSRDMAKAISDSIEEVQRLKEVVNQTENIDNKLRDKLNVYFQTILNAETKWDEGWIFFADYFENVSTLYTTGQRTSEFLQMSNQQEYFSNTYNWFKDNQEAIFEWRDNNIVALETLKAPDYLAEPWEKYKKCFDVMYRTTRKGKTNTDYLPYFSKINQTVRGVLTEKYEYNGVLNATNNEFAFVETQIEDASELAEEIIKYTELDKISRDSYEFEWNKENCLLYNYDAVETIYPSLNSTYDAYVIIEIGCVTGNRDVVVEAEIPGFTQKFKQKYQLDSGYKRLYIKPAILPGNLDLKTAKDEQINVSIYESDGTTLIDAKTFPLKIMSINDVDWRNDEFGVATMDNILTYLTPDADAIDVLKRNAISCISNITGGKMENIVGYQETGFNHYAGTFLQAAGIMRAMYDMGIRYDSDSFSISEGHQRVKLPSEVINKKSGLCIETSLTVASALQNAGFNCFIIMPPGHAQVAVEVWGKDGEGAGEYFLIETTLLDNESNNDEICRNYANALIEKKFDKLPNCPMIEYYAPDEWYAYIIKKGAYVIDCNDSRVLGLIEFTN